MKISKEKCFIIAEAGVNHNGNTDRALEMVRAAADAGADAVKFQTFRTEQIVAHDAEKAEYQKNETGDACSQFDMLKQLELPESAYPEIIGECKNNNILFMSTAFDVESADFLDQLGMDIFKIPSGELTNLPLISHIAAKQKQMIVSTGMTTLKEIAACVECIKKRGNSDITLLQCTSNYPANYADVNLLAMQTLYDEFDCPAGFSDHTLGIETSIAAVALGAVVIEKHFTLDKTLPGPDHKMSLEPDELQQMITSIRNVEKALGSKDKSLLECERDVANVAKKSIHYSRDLPSGTTLSENDLVMLRPGTGITPAKIADITGKSLIRNVSAGTVLKLDDFGEKDFTELLETE